MGDAMFFPTFLNKGSKGPPVALLQCLLIDRGCNSDNITVDGDYGEETAKGVFELQKELGVEADGNFGPQTREALANECGAPGLDVNKIPASAFSGPTTAIGLD